MVADTFVQFFNADVDRNSLKIRPVSDDGWNQVECASCEVQLGTADVTKRGTLDFRFFFAFNFVCRDQSRRALAETSPEVGRFATAAVAAIQRGDIRGFDDSFTFHAR